MKLRMISAAAAAMFAFTAGMALANTFNVPGGDLDAALDVYSQQSGVRIAVSMEAVQGMKTTGAKGEMSPEAALMKIRRRRLWHEGIQAEEIQLLRV